MFYLIYYDMRDEGNSVDILDIPDELNFDKVFQRWSEAGHDNENRSVIKMKNYDIIIDNQIGVPRTLDSMLNNRKDYEVVNMRDLAKISWEDIDQNVKDYVLDLIKNSNTIGAAYLKGAINGNGS
jgi:hypothetical protein